MFCVIQFFFCLLGFVVSLGVIAFIVFIFDDIRLCNVFEVLFLVFCIIVLFAIAVMFVWLGTVEVTV